MNRLIPWVFPTLVCISLLGILLPAFGYMPALGFETFTFELWRELLATPGIKRMVATTLWVGFSATALALLLTLLFTVSAWQTPLWRWTERLIAPLIAIPHSALAIGVVFLLAPSGLLSRLAAFLLGWNSPPDLLIINDPWGISLILALITKEAPFLCLMAIAAAGQTPISDTLTCGRSLGYSPLQCWLKLIWPQLYPKLRLSVLIVLAFSVSVVDVSLIIGPQLPPLLPVQILHWQQSPNGDTALLASTGALMLLLLVGLAMGVWLMVERVTTITLNNWLLAGTRGSQSPRLNTMAGMLFCLFLMFALGALAIVALWSFSWRWPFPELLPPSLSLRVWSRYLPQIWQPLWTTLTLALTSTLLAIVLAITCLEQQRTMGPWQQKLTVAFFYLPLLLPQLSFLMGIQLPLVALRLDGHWPTVVGSHLLYVLPYCYLSLAGVWKRYDQRYVQTGLMLSGSPVRTFIQIKLPMLLPAILTSVALGIAVSTTLYLPTVMTGAGRFATLTTEAVALSSGGSRRLLSLYAIAQMLVPALFFVAAGLLPRLPMALYRLRALFRDPPRIDYGS